jgi:Uma2 family endonuclease
MVNTKTPPGREYEPTWEIAHLFPNQGMWSEEEFLALDTNRLIELSDGYLEFLKMPTQSHQFIVLYLYRVLLAFLEAHELGTVLTAPLRVQLWPGKYREPDVVFMLAKHDDRRGERYWVGADLVMEVVSPDDPQRDLVTKREEFAEAGITEYWIVDPRNSHITVLDLEGTQYAVHGKFKPGQKAISRLLPGFSVDVTAVFAAAR